MLNRLPRQIPPLETLLRDIGNPSNTEIAKALRVSKRTVQRWRAKDDAPRVALLSLFWVTRWGMSIVDCEAVNAASLNAEIAHMLQSRINSLQAKLNKMGTLASFGSANDPFEEVESRTQVKPLLARLEPVEPVDPNRQTEKTEENQGTQPRVNHGR